MPKFEDYDEKLTLDAADLLVLKDSVDGKTKRIQGVNVTGGASSDPRELFRWNGVDLSQFRNGGTPELDTSGGALLTLNPTGMRKKPVLRFTGGGAFGYAQWVFDPSLFASIPERYILEIYYDEFDNGAGVKGPLMEVGLSHFCRYNAPNNVRAYSLCQSGNGNYFLQLWTRDTVFANPGATPTAANPGTNANRGSRHRMDVVQDRDTTFEMFYMGTYQGSGIEYTQNQVGGSNLDFDAGAFDGLVPNTFGIAARWNGAFPGWCEISALRILKHPADA